MWAIPPQSHTSVCVSATPHMNATLKSPFLWWTPRWSWSSHLHPSPPPAGPLWCVCRHLSIMITDGSENHWLFIQTKMLIYFRVTGCWEQLYTQETTVIGKKNRSYFQAIFRGQAAFSVSCFLLPDNICASKKKETCNKRFILLSIHLPIILPIRYCFAPKC